MKCLKFILFFALVFALGTSFRVESTNNEDVPLMDNSHNQDFLLTENYKRAHSLRGASRFFGPKTRFALTTCNRYPSICRTSGSPGPNCCNRRCVNLAKDRFNCGKCGLWCKYSEICCNGQCVNPLKDKNHCGGCNNKCKKESKCMYGMCGYAQDLLWP